MTQEMKVARTLTEIDNMEKEIDRKYERMFNNVSVNQMGEASAEETARINRWYENAREDLKKDATAMWKNCFRQQYDEKLVKKVENLVAMKMLKSKSGREASVEYTGKNKVHGFGGVNEFFFQKGSDGYSIYQGCDLVVGDTSLRSCVVAMLQICNM